MVPVELEELGDEGFPPELEPDPGPVALDPPDAVLLEPGAATPGTSKAIGGVGTELGEPEELPLAEDEEVDVLLALVAVVVVSPPLQEESIPWMLW